MPNPHPVSFSPLVSCQGDSSTVAVDPLTISGTVLTKGSGFPLAGAGGVSIQVFTKTGSTAIASTTADSSGNFSLSVSTGGIPFDGYLLISGTNYLTAGAYWSKPLTAATTTSPMVLKNDSAFLYELAGVSQQPGTSPIAFRVTDCNGTPLGNSFLSFDGAGDGPYTAQHLGFNFGAPNFWFLNAPNGTQTVNANLIGHSFVQTTFNTVDGQTTYVTITP